MEAIVFDKRGLRTYEVDHIIESETTVTLYQQGKRLVELNKDKDTRLIMRLAHE